MSDPIATEIEVVINTVRNAQLEHDEATENLQRIIEEHNLANERVNVTGQALCDAREQMYAVVVEKPWNKTILDEVSNISKPIRVVSPWVDENVDAAWSEKGPEA